MTYIPTGYGMYQDHFSAIDELPEKLWREAKEAAARMSQEGKRAAYDIYLKACLKHGAVPLNYSEVD